MKTEKVEKYKNKLLKLKLIQTKTYTKKQYFNNIKLEDIQYRLKKIFYIIYKYHIFNKKILFIGAPFNLKMSHILKATNHIFIPNSIWVKGALSNKKLSFKNLLHQEKTAKNKITELLLKLKKNIDLILILDELNNVNILNESYVSRIPVITLNSNLNIISNKPSYKVPGNFQFLHKKIRDNIFYSMLLSTLKKGDIYKRKLKSINDLKPTKSQIFNKYDTHKKFNFFKNTIKK